MKEAGQETRVGRK